MNKCRLTSKSMCPLLANRKRRGTEAANEPKKHAILPAHVCVLAFVFALVCVCGYAVPNIVTESCHFTRTLRLFQGRLVLAAPPILLPSIPPNTASPSPADESQRGSQIEWLFPVTLPSPDLRRLLSLTPTKRC